MAYEREAMLALLQDVAESEHHLRHPDAFAAVVEASGFVLERLPHKFVVSDPDAPKPEPAPPVEAAVVE